MNNNPGVGLRMTSRRTNIHEQSNHYHNCNIPGPQSYDIQFKLTDRERRQNELLSRRYDNWKKDPYHPYQIYSKKNQHQQQQPFITVMGEQGHGNGVTGVSTIRRAGTSIGLNKESQIISTERSFPHCNNTNTSGNNPGVGLKKTSRRIIYVKHDLSYGRNKVAHIGGGGSGPPFYDMNIN